jgi:hypothetical protein
MEKTESGTIAYLNEKTEKFNACANKSVPKSWQDLDNQMKIIESEIKEMRDAIDTRDAVELLDGYVDGMVTLLGMRDMLSNLNFDVQGAESAVADNNDTKFIRFFDDGFYDTVALTKIKYMKDGVTIETVHNPQHDVYAFVDEKGKVRKPVNYQNVNLKPYVPFKLFGENTNAAT